MTRFPALRRPLVLLSSSLVIACWLASPLPLRTPRAGAQTGVLVLDSFTKSQNFDWTLSGDGRSAGKDGQWGRQEIDFPAPSSIPAEGARFTWTLRSTATVSNQATECEMRAGGFTVTATPGPHASAWSPRPGETGTITIDTFVKPTSVAAGVTAQISVSCFSNFGVTFLYRSAAAATTTAAPTTQPSRPATCASGTRQEGADVVVRFAVGVSAQAVEVDCSVALTITSPKGDPRFARVVPGTTVWVRVSAATLLPGDHLVVTGRTKAGQEWTVYDCKRESCDFWLRSAKGESFEMQAAHVLGVDSSTISTSDPVWVTWESPTKPLTFDWSVPERLTRSANGRITSSPMSPDAWPVDLTVGGTCPDRRKRGTTYAWSYVDTSGTKRDLSATPTGRCTWRAKFDGPTKLTGGATGEGVYPVTVKVTTLADGTYEGTRNVTIEDWLVLGLGDSLASGEGAPIGPSTWDDLQCDRSSKSYQALAARRLEERDTKSSVTFVHLGCSGAAIIDHSPSNNLANGGLLSAYQGINPAGDLPGQVDEARRLVGTRKVDAVLLSAGVNDLEFGSIVTLCGNPVVTTGGEDCDADAFTDSAGVQWDPLPTFIESRVAELPGLYRQLDAALGTALATGYPEGRLPAGRVLITEYPDTLHDDRGELCDGLDVTGLNFLQRETLASLNGGEVFFLWSGLWFPLQRAVLDTVSLGWRIVPTSKAGFLKHGYCARDNWVVTTRESRRRQTTVFGAFHPSERGHIEIGTQAYNELSAVLPSPT
jgi:hypothetical protein